MRFFKATPELSQHMRSQVMAALEQPNGKADEPWPVGGDFQDDEGLIFLALAPHQTEGEFWESLIAMALSAGVVEITASQYQAAKPQAVEL